MNYYELLNLSPTATTDEIRKAYRELARFYHPDQNKSIHAEQMMIKLNDAKEILLNEEKRKIYDINLNRPIQVEKQYYYNQPEEQQEQRQEQQFKSTVLSREEQKQYEGMRMRFFWTFLTRNHRPFLLKLLMLIAYFSCFLILTFIRLILLVLLCICAIFGEIGIYYLGLGLLFLILIVVSFFLVDAVTRQNFLEELKHDIIYIIYYLIPPAIWVIFTGSCYLAMEGTYKIQEFVYTNLFWRG